MKKNRLKLIIVCAAVVAVVLLLVNIADNSAGTVKSIYDIEAGAKCRISKYNNGILCVGYDGIKLLSSAGEEIGSIENHLSDPHIEVRGEYILLYDKNGTSVSLYKDEREIYSYESERSIKKARVNKNGYVLLMTDETGYHSKISVLTPKGKVEYIWKIGDVYVVDADISPDNNRIAVSSIATDSGTIVENMIFADIDEEKEIARVINDGSMPLYVKYANSGQIISISDDRLCGYNANGERKWEQNFNSKLLNSFDVDDNGNAVLALSGIKNNTILETYTKNGSKSGEYTTKAVVKAIDINGKYISVYEPGNISVLNYSGKLLGENSVSKEYSDILTIGRRSVVLMGTQSIDRLGL